MAGDNPKLYFRRYRQGLGFSNQQDAKSFLSAKDIAAPIDYAYIESLLGRLREILVKLNAAIHGDAGIQALDRFCDEHVTRNFEIILQAGILPRLNNQGRRPEEVLFSWLRGHAVNMFFGPALARILQVNLEQMAMIGDDDLSNPETFKRTPKADIELSFKGQVLRLEIQSGFQGVNDIKEHKVREARRVFEDFRKPTVCIHYDIFNGQTAFVRLDRIEDGDVNWVTRQQMEGQSVFAIDQNHFDWRLLDPIPCAEEIEALNDL